MTNLEEIKGLLGKLRNEYESVGIQHFPQEDIELRKVKMLEVLNENLQKLQSKKDDFLGIGQSLAEELKILEKKTAEINKLIWHLEEDVEKVDLQLSRVKGYILTFSDNSTNKT